MSKYRPPQWEKFAVEAVRKTLFSPILWNKERAYVEAGGEAMLKALEGAGLIKLPEVVDAE